MQEVQDENPNLNVEPIIWDAAQVEPDRLLLERADRLDADYKERGYILSVWRYEDGSNWVWFVQYASPGTGYGGPWPEWAFEQAKAALVGKTPAGKGMLLRSGRVRHSLNTRL